MKEFRLGAFVVQHRYRVDPNERPKLLNLLGQIRDHAYDLGVAQFEVWLEDADSWLVTEIHGYDSWSHFKRLSAKDLPETMQDVYAELERLIEGGLGGIETHTWNAATLPEP